MNSWDSFNQYEEEQRRMRLDKERQSAEQQRSKKQQQQAQMRRIADELRQAEKQRRDTHKAVADHLPGVGKVIVKSPIETDFHEAWRKLYPSIELLPQHRIGKYRVDFAHVETMTAIELDGHEHHHSRHDRNKDYRRQHMIEDEGWTFVRFTGSQVWGDVEACVSRVYKIVVKRMAR